MHTLEKLESKLKKIIGIQKPTGNVRKEQNLGIKNVTDNYLGRKRKFYHTRRPGGTSLKICS